MQQAHASDRELPIDGAFNVRDIGGLPTAGGGVTRRGLVYRSGDLARLTVAGADQLRALGVATVVDLRTSLEVERRGRFPLEGNGIAYRHWPLLDRSATESETRLADLPPNLLDQLNRLIATEGGRNLAQVLTWLAEPGTLPVAIHCVAGKDRTGMVIAVLLALLEVPDEEIAEDYALSEAGLAALRSWAETHEPEVAAWLDRVPPGLLEAKPVQMLETLRWLGEQHGSIEAYARSVGVGAETIAALRELLRSPA